MFFSCSAGYSALQALSRICPCRNFPSIYAPDQCSAQDAARGELIGPSAHGIENLIAAYSARIFRKAAEPTGCSRSDSCPPCTTVNLVSERTVACGSSRGRQTADSSFADNLPHIKDAFPFSRTCAVLRPRFARPCHIQQPTRIPLSPPSYTYDPIPSHPNHSIAIPHDPRTPRSSSATPPDRRTSKSTRQRAD